jgi:hypothetical protein
MPGARKTVERKSPTKSAARTQQREAYGDPDVSVDRDAIARLAHSYWLARNGHGGSPEDDWLRAEQELKGRTMAAAADCRHRSACQSEMAREMTPHV